MTTNLTSWVFLTVLDWWYHWKTTLHLVTPLHVALHQMPCSPQAKASWSLNPVSPVSHSPFWLSALRFLVWVPGLPATISALSQVAPSSCTSHCWHRQVVLLFLATSSKQLMLRKYIFPCIYLLKDACIDAPVTATQDFGKKGEYFVSWWEGTSVL